MRELRFDFKFHHKVHPHVDGAAAPVGISAVHRPADEPEVIGLGALGGADREIVRRLAYHQKRCLQAVCKCFCTVGPRLFAAYQQEREIRLSGGFQLFASSVERDDLAFGIARSSAKYAAVFGESRRDVWRYGVHVRAEHYLGVVPPFEEQIMSAVAHFQKFPVRGLKPFVEKMRERILLSGSGIHLQDVFEKRKQVGVHYLKMSVSSLDAAIIAPSPAPWMMSGVG